MEDDFTEISEKLKIDVTVTEEDDDVIDNLVGKWMIVMVSTMVNPNNFHVVFPYGGFDAFVFSMLLYFSISALDHGKIYVQNIHL